jgi:hypothetical protein
MQKFLRFALARVALFGAAHAAGGALGVKRPALFLGVVAAALHIGLLLSPQGLTVFAESAQATPGQAMIQRSVGRWVRPDGGYILELSAAEKEKGLQAAYFNPLPIHVARAEVRCEQGRCTILIELRDINYPGSRYTLRYDPMTDRLKGDYFQAVQKETYLIEFVRIKR